MWAAAQLLEPRRLLSAWYEYDVAASKGDPVVQGGSLTDLLDVSVNSRGRVAFTGNTAAGSNVFADGGAAAPTQLIGFDPPQSNRAYGFPQVNDGDNVAARDQVSGSPPGTVVRTWNSTAPGAFTLVASNTTLEPFPGFDSVTLPSVANDGQFAFIGIRGTQVGLYRNPDQVRGNNVLVTALNGGGFRPMIADGGATVIRDGSGTGGMLKVNGTPKATVGAGGWTALGAAPGISDDGAVVAFAGDRGNGPGVFVFVRNAGGSYDGPYRVAGEGSAANPVPDMGYDASGQKITFASIDYNSRVAVTHAAFGPAGPAGDAVVVSFLGTPTLATPGGPAPAGPTLFNRNYGLWTVRVELQNQLSSPFALGVHPSGAVPVAQLGDHIAGTVISGLSVFDPLSVASASPAGASRTAAAGDHVVAFLATDASGGKRVVRAFSLDDDGDGLLNHWERPGGGIDVDADGAADLRLSDWGATVDHRDLFIEADWAVPRLDAAQAWSNEPHAGVFQFLDGMFAAAPNPDGTTGIRLHVDAGPGVGRSLNTGAGTLRGGDQFSLPGGVHPDLLYFGAPGTVVVPSGVNAVSFTDVKAAHFANADKGARELAFRYLLFGDFHSLVQDTSGNVNLQDHPFSAPVASATANGLVWSGTSVPQLPQTKLAGHVVKITAGKGAGQLRVIRGANYGSKALTVDPWMVQPDATSQFAILHGSSGRAEAAWYPGPDNTGIPGNDFAVTMGGFTRTSGRLSNAKNMQRTIAHELGHTLGLRHGGTDHNAYKGNAYLSLMSYSHQLSQTSTVASYSFAADPTFDDWANVRLDFQRSMIHLGNSFGARLGDVPEDEPALNEVEHEQVAGPFDLVPPKVASSTFAFDALPPKVVLTFSEDVGASIGDGDVALVNQTTGVTPPAGAVIRSYDPASRTLTLTFAAAVPADGNYRLTIAADAVADAAGNPLAADFSFGFFVLGGDANRDGMVDFNDLVALAQNYGRAGATYAQGDFSRDGTVDFNDLVILAQRYGTSLPPLPTTGLAPSPLTGAIGRVGDEDRGPVFSTTPVRPASTPATPRAPARRQRRR